MTPAQASGHPNFIVDVPVQGPTDEGLRAGDCWWAQNRLPDPPTCVDCKGPVPVWNKPHGVGGTKETSNMTGLIGFGDQNLSFGGAPMRGFGVGAAGDPDIWDKLSGAQQSWLATVKQKLNDLIVKTTGTKCATWGPNVTSAESTKCFQNWYNSYGLDQLRTDGVLDKDTLSALIATAQAHTEDFPQFPGTPPSGVEIYKGVPSDAPAEKKLSTGAMVGIAAAVAAAGGGIVYVATRKKSRRSR